MNKPLSFATKQSSWLDFSSRLKAKWRLNTKQLDQSPDNADLLTLLDHLVRIPTVTGNYEANHDALDYIEQFLNKRSMHVERLEWNGIESLVATTKKTKTPAVMLAGHIDVVTAPNELFALNEKDDRLYGRGVLDMKSAIATYLKLVDNLADTITEYDLGIMITTDEEVGGFDGVDKLTDAGYLPKVCILPDGGDNWQIQTSAKGAMGLALSAKGTAAHGSRPWEGDNAVLRLMETVQEIYNLFPDKMGHKTNTASIGKINGGQVVNQVADTAELLLDVRAVSEDERMRLLGAIESICSKRNIEVSLDWNLSATEFDLKNPYIHYFAQLIKEATGVTVHGAHTSGNNDTRFFARYNVPCISFYPVGGGHHGPDEWIDKQALFNMQRIIQRYVERMGKTTVSID